MTKASLVVNLDVPVGVITIDDGVARVANARACTMNRDVHRHADLAPYVYLSVWICVRQLASVFGVHRSNIDSDCMRGAVCW